MPRHVLTLCAAGAFALAAGPASAQIEGIPRYEHIILIIAENHGFDQIIDKPVAPHISKLAKDYGLATNYYGIVHPSKANYIAMIGGSTFGLHDDDAYYCRAGNPDRYCDSQATIHPYVDHTIADRSLVDQLAERNLTWKGYFESIPAPGSKAVYFPDLHSPVHGQPNELYASKHNAFINFKSVQEDPDFAEKIVGFDRGSPISQAGNSPITRTSCPISATRCTAGIRGRTCRSTVSSAMIPAVSPAATR